MKRRLWLIIVLIVLIASTLLFVACSGEQKPSEITITVQPTTAKVVLGMDPDFSGGKVEVTFEDGSVREISMTELSYTGLNNQILGTQTVALQYTSGGKTVSTAIDLTVVSPKVTKLELSTENVKVDYVDGDTFDKTGLVVTATYQTGEVAAVTAYEVSPRTLTPDVTSVKITHRGVSVTLPVTVVPRASASVVVTANPTKTTYYVGETFLSSGLEVTVTNNDGSIEVFKDGEEGIRYYYNGTSTPFSMVNSQGNNVVKIVVDAKYGETSTTLILTGVAVVPTKLTIISPVSEEDAFVFTEGDSFSIDGTISARIEYNNGTSRPATGSDLEYSTETPLSAGQDSYTVFVRGYPSVTATLPICVEAATVTSIEIMIPPKKGEYSAGESVDLTDLRLKVNYSNDLSDELDYSPESGITATPDVVADTGSYSVTITVWYCGVSDTFTIALVA